MATNNLKLDIDQVRYNPTKIQTAILRRMRDVDNVQYDVVDPSNPFIFLMDAAATIGASCMTESANNNRKQYPAVTQSLEDLYRHMHYDSFNDIFSLPTQATFVIGFNKTELLSRMVRVGSTEIKKLVIPRNTTITAGDITFSLQYPIELRQLSIGELQVAYDVSKTTPLKTIDTNVIEWSPVRDVTGQEMVFFPVTVDQFSIISLTDIVSLSQKFSLSKTISDKFYFCRVWRETNAGWEGIRTTYSQDIYDNKVVTAIVKVIDNQVTVEIPIVYAKTGQISGKIRVDIYQTKGPLAIDLRDFDSKQFVMNWLSIDEKEKSIYTAPLSSMATTTVYAASRTTGGREPMGFDALKERVMSNGFNAGNAPITPAQAKSKLERKGYNIVTTLDHVTNRVFAATRAMPVPLDAELITAANAGIHTLSESIANLSVLASAHSNKDSLTLAPTTLYKVVQGVLQVCSDTEIALINSLPGDKKALAITEGSYFYSPFHYVFDADNDTFASRAYYLDAPKINSRSFIAENEKTLLQVNTSSALFQRTADGWAIIVTTRSSQEWKDLPDNEVFVNIGFQPDNSGDYAYIPGVFLGATDQFERVYRFDIKTNFDIDANNALQLTSAMMYEQSQQFLRTALNQKFDLFYSTTHIAPPGWEPVSFDPLLGSFLLPSGAIGIARERLDLTFGSALSNLWTSGRSVVGNQDYARWDLDIPVTYENDVYTVDPVTGVSFTIIDGVLTYNKLHNAGDIKYNTEGEVVYKFRKGDIKRDVYNNPIVIGSRKLVRQVDLFLLEAQYYFATNKAAVDYRGLLVETIVQWIADDLKEISKQLLDKTSIFFYPVQNVGTVDIIHGAGLKSTINAGQYFNLKIYVRDSVYKNTKLRAAINRTAVVTLAECLKSKTVSNSQIIDGLRIAFGADVLSFEIEGLGGTAKLSICTMVDDSARLTLRKRLEYRPDQTFALVEDVNSEFIPHERAGVTLDI